MENCWYPRVRWLSSRTRVQRHLVYPRSNGGLTNVDIVRLFKGADKKIRWRSQRRKARGLLLFRRAIFRGTE